MALTVASALQSILPLQSLDATAHVTSEKATPAPAFISWPKEEKGHRVQDVVVNKPADQLFNELWGAKAPVALISREKMGVHGYKETQWQINESDAESALLAVTARPESPLGSSGLWQQQLTGRDYKRRCRMNFSEGHRLGKAVHSFERERCLDAADGGPYALEICVHSTAPMAHRFRCVFMHRIEAIDSHQCRWTGDFALVFVEKTNFLLRKPIEAGALREIRHNFQTMKEILEAPAEG